MKKCCHLSTLCVMCVVLAVVSVATIVTLWTVALTGGGDAAAAPWDRFRLPPSLVPESYSVTLWPRLRRDPTSDLYTFTGEATVRFDCVAETDLILIHSYKLNYTKLENNHYVRLAAADGGAAPDVLSSWLQVQTQYLVVHLGAALSRGRTYELHAEFAGELADDLAGFYRSEYEEGGVRKILAASQMHPTHARKTFPCFDEPAMKAVFNVTLIHPPGTVALSNGLEIDVANVTLGGETVTRSRFESSRRMSSYLLALVVCDYGSLRAKSGDTLIRVWARRELLDQGQGDYALNRTGPILDFLQRYYSAPYPLSKSDQIALPDFYFGAMENWGLVTYRETKLLYDPSTSSNRDREATVTIIAHELAHMWFGNLVTLRWWNEVWLNEGFASYVAYLGADHAEPDWNLKELIVLDHIQKVFAVDALTSSHPLSSREDDVVLPHHISQQFDVVSYSKGAAVLRMLSDFLSEPVFVQALSTYLNHFAESNTVGSDLWRHLQMAAEENRLPLPAAVDDIMQPWVQQMGFPVVTIDTSRGAISQQHFLLDPEANVTAPSPYKYQWPVPMRWTSGGRPSALYWLLEEQAVNLDMRGGASWILANVNVTGFYRVNYDLGNWERLLVQLSTDHQVFPVSNRAQLLDDAFNLARAGLLSSSLALRTSQFLSQETDFLPWQAAVNNLDYFYLMLDQTEVYRPLQDYVRKQVTPLFFHFKNKTGNWSRIPERHNDQSGQAVALQAACSSALPECVRLSSSWFSSWMKEPQNNRIHPNLRSAVYCSAVAAGGPDQWEFGWSQFKMASVASEASKLMSALACASDTELLQRFLSYTLNASLIRKQDAAAVISTVAANRVGHNLAWDFVRENWNYMFTQYGVGSFSFASIISGVTTRFSTPEHLRQLEQFVQQQGPGGLGSASQAVDQALEKTRANIRWVQNNKLEILDWLLSHAGPEDGEPGLKPFVPQTYLNHFAESNTVGSDLWRHLQMAAEENRLPLPAAVDDIMQPWVQQMGFPVVTIDTSRGAISQQHFLLDPEANVTAPSPYKYQWPVPMRWTSGGRPSALYWLLEEQAVNLDMRGGASWILANVNVTGFYRVNYDLGNWERLLVQLSTDHQVFPVSNRAQLLDDAFNLARAGLLSSSLALRTSQFLSQETDFLPWQAAVNNLDYFYLMLDQTEVYRPLQDYVRKQVTPLFFHFKNKTGNWSRIPERHNDQSGQAVALQAACSSALPECVRLSSSWFSSWMKEPQNNRIHPNLRSAVYCSAVAAGGPDQWEFGWSQFKMASVASEASKLMSALACASDTELLQRFLSYTLNASLIRKQDAAAVISTVAANRVGHNLAWDFVRENWNYMFTQYGVGSFSFASIISGVTTRFSTPEHLRQLEQFVQQQGPGGLGSASQAVDQALEKTRANIRWVQNNKLEILDWLLSHAGPEDGEPGLKLD